MTNLEKIKNLLLYFSRVNFAFSEDVKKQLGEIITHSYAELYRALSVIDADVKVERVMLAQHWSMWESPMVKISERDRAHTVIASRHL